MPTDTIWATLTADQVDDALAEGAWADADPSLALWLNTAFPPAGRTEADLLADLDAHGVIVD